MALLAPSPPRPDMRAYKEAYSLDFPEVTRKLSEVIGKKLAAYIAGVKDVRAVDRWISGVEPYNGAEARIRLSYHVARMLSDHVGTRVVQSWFTGLNPELDDRAPARLLREGDPAENGVIVLKAARAFIVGG